MQVARERAGEAIDRQSLQAVTKMMCELGKPVYVADLERPFLDASREHFQCAPPLSPRVAPAEPALTPCVRATDGSLSLSCSDTGFGKRAAAGFSVARVQGGGAAVPGGDGLPRVL